MPQDGDLLQPDARAAGSLRHMQDVFFSHNATCMSRRSRLELDASVHCIPACGSDAVQQPNTSAVEILISGFL